MRTIATHIARIAWSVCLCCSHGRACRYDWTDRDAVWGADLGEPKELHVCSIYQMGVESRDRMGRGNFWELSGPLQSIAVYIMAVTEQSSWHR